MSSSITVRGFAATQPKFVIVNGLSISSFRVGSSERRYNRSSGGWENGMTSWFSVSCFRELATNVFASVNKGDPIIVTGRLKVSEWSAGDKSGLDVEIEAEGIGHDFRWGKSMGFAKNNGKSSGGKHDGEDAQDDVREEELKLASARVLDAGEPMMPPLLGLDPESGELVEEGEEAAVAAAPF